MTTLAGARADLDSRMDAIESGYEFMLAYAAQGRATDRSGGGGRSSIREHLTAMLDALDGLGDVAASCVRGRDPGLADEVEPFLLAVAEDAERARAVVRLATAQQDISSRLIDNLNASIHLRALLTDLFVLDEAIKVQAKTPG
jgi:hypothetical protein